MHCHVDSAPVMYLFQESQDVEPPPRTLWYYNQYTVSFILVAITVQYVLAQSLRLYYKQPRMMTSYSNCRPFKGRWLWAGL